MEKQQVQNEKAEKEIEILQQLLIQARQALELCSKRISELETTIRVLGGMI